MFNFICPVEYIPETTKNGKEKNGREEKRIRKYHLNLICYLKETLFCNNI
jgi:hypothetical protein